MSDKAVNLNALISAKTKKALMLSFFLIAYLIVLCVYVFNINQGNVASYKSSLIVTTLAAFLPIFIAWSYDSNIFVAGVSAGLILTGTAFQATLSPGKDVKLIFVVGIIVMVLVMALLKLYERMEAGTNQKTFKLLYFASTAFTLLAGILLRLVAKPENGAYCWIKIAGTSLQLTEIIKLVFIVGLVCAYKISDSDSSIIKKTTALFLSTAMGFVIVNEAGSLAVCFFTWLVFMFFVIQKPKTYISFIMFVALSVGAAIIAIYIISTLIIKHQINTDNGKETIIDTLCQLVLKIRNRLDAVIPGKSGDNYQVNRALSLIKLGGLFGHLTRAVNTLFSAESDMVFASLTSRFGCVIGSCVIISFLFIFVSAVNKRFEERKEWHILVAASSMIFVQALISICSCLRILPVIGISIPFIGEGGTNMLANFSLLITMLWAMRESGDGKTAILRKEDIINED